MSIAVWFDWPEESESRQKSVPCDTPPQYLPRIGEHVGIRPLDGHDAVILDVVLDVRHYYYDKGGRPHQEVRILLGKPQGAVSDRDRSQQIA